MAISWQVVSTRQVQETLLDGRIGDVWVVIFRTSLGTVGQVRIPDDVYSAPVAADMIAETVARISEVDGLTGTVGDE